MDSCNFPSQEKEHFLLYLWRFLYTTNGTRSIPGTSSGVQFCFPANDWVFDLCVQLPWKTGSPKTSLSRQGTVHCVCCACNRATRSVPQLQPMWGGTWLCLSHLILFLTSPSSLKSSFLRHLLLPLRANGQGRCPCPVQENALFSLALREMAKFRMMFLPGST